MTEKHVQKIELNWKNSKTKEKARKNRLRSNLYHYITPIQKNSTTMIHHTVLLKLLPTVTAAQKATLLATILEKLGPSLPGTAAAAGEPIFTERAGGYELGLYSSLYI